MREDENTHFVIQKGRDGTLHLRLTEQAKEEFKTVQWIEMPTVGKKIEQNQPLIAIESTKAIFELESPVSGNVIEVKISPTAPLELLIRMQPVES